MQLLRKRNRRVIVTHLASLTGLLIRKRNAVVNVQDAIDTTRRPDGSRRLHAILLGVHLAQREFTAASGRHARCLRLTRILREVVRRDEVARHAFVESCVPVVGSVDYGVLEATWVLEVEVDLAVLAAVCGRGAGPDVCLECIETVGDDLFVV